MAMTKDVHSLPDYLDFIEREIGRKDMNSKSSNSFLDISVRFMNKNMVPNLKTYLEEKSFFTEINVRECPRGLYDIILRW